MNSLYNIFQNEKERNPDMTVYYNKQTNSISYRNEEGTLTALFRGENEYFYFKSPNKKPEEMQTNIGDMILNTCLIWQIIWTSRNSSIKSLHRRRAWSKEHK